MRFVRKTAYTCHPLDQAHTFPPQTAEQAKSRWSSFGHRREVVGILLDSQYGLCAYSEIGSDLEDFKLGTHIEHVKPKSDYPLLTFDYDNLVLCALNSQDLGRLRDVDYFGGHAKLGQYDPDLFVSCLQPDCRRFFSYISDGRVVPSESLDADDSTRAIYTIELLNLNAPILVVQRKKWLDEIDELIEEHLNKNDNLTDLASIDLLPVNGKLKSFFSATRERYLSLGEQVLRDNAPELV